MKIVSFRKYLDLILSVIDIKGIFDKEMIKLIMINLADKVKSVIPVERQIMGTEMMGWIQSTEKIKTNRDSWLM